MLLLFLFLTNYDAYLPGNSGKSWHAGVVEPCVDIVKCFFFEEMGDLRISTEMGDVHNQSHVPRDLWSQYVCEVCILLSNQNICYQRANFWLTLFKILN